MEDSVTLCFFQIFHQSYLKKNIFEKIKEINQYKKTYKYDSIISFDWMIENGYHNLLKYKLRRNDCYIHFSLNPDLIFTLKDRELFELSFKRFSNYFPPHYPLLITTAARFNNHDAIRYLADDSLHYPRSYRGSVNSQALMYITLHKGEHVLPMVKFMVATFNIPVVEGTLKNAIRNNDYELCRYLISIINKYEHEFRVEMLLTWTCSYGDLKLFKLIYENFTQPINEAILQSATNNAPVFIYLFELANITNEKTHWIFKPSTTIMLANVQLDSPSIIENLLSSAIMNGNLEIVKYIHGKNFLISIDRILNTLVKLSLNSGHLDVFIYFESLFNSARSSINDMFLCDIKNVSNQLESVVLFHETFQLKIKPDCLCQSLQSTDIRVFHYLFSKGDFQILNSKIFFRSTVDITHNIIKEACSCYNLQVLEYLLQSGVKHSSTLQMGEINWRELGSRDENLRLIQVVLEICTPVRQYLLKMMEQAGYFGQTKIFKYLYLNFLSDSVQDTTEFRTVFSLILSKKRIEFVKFLLQNGEKVPQFYIGEYELLGIAKDVQDPNINYSQLLTQATSFGNLDVLKKFLPMASINLEELLIPALDNGHYDCTMYIINELGYKPSTYKLIQKGLENRNYLIAQYFYHHHFQDFKFKIQQLFDHFILTGNLDSIAFYHNLGCSPTVANITFLLNRQIYWVLEYFRGKVDKHLLSKIDVKKLSYPSNDHYTIYVKNYLVQYSPATPSKNSFFNFNCIIN
ncbi:hypothetical protein CYY_008092 [Polysphondylium violaceum]|uniref:Ankyrin repeat-containing protein n=1 Tax=Polysphondylium violaceum TaxID=133409 RepID=A0A8J4PM58_9MYCE|nr:hypothetical protein CYY_008092 [Polysphondylium violaceum]